MKDLTLAEWWADWRDDPSDQPLWLFGHGWIA